MRTIRLIVRDPQSVPVLLANVMLRPYDNSGLVAGFYHDDILEFTTNSVGGAERWVTAEGFAPVNDSVVLEDWLPEVHLVPVATAGPLSIQGDQFVRNGQRWLVKGSTELQLAARVAKGDDVRPVLEQRKAAGANLGRVLGMHEGAGFLPSMTPAYADIVTRTADLFSDAGLVLLWCVFAGAKQMMPSQQHQLEFWQYSQELLRPYASFVLLDLGNEMNHGQWGGVNPDAFPKPFGLLSSRGSFLTDERPPEPWWDFVVYHARRDYPTPKGATNYDPYVFLDNESWPFVPMFPEEGIKPHQHGFNHDWMRLMAKHAKVANGGLAHTEEGVYSLPWPSHVEACVRVFFEELQA